MSTTLYEARVQSTLGTKLVLEVVRKVPECPDPSNVPFALLALATAALEPMPDRLVGSLPTALAPDPDALFGLLQDLVEADRAEVEKVAAPYIASVRAVSRVQDTITLEVSVTEPRWLDHLAVERRWEGLFVFSTPEAEREAREAERRGAPKAKKKPSGHVPGARVAVKIEYALRGAVVRQVGQAVQVTLDCGPTVWVSNRKLTPIAHDDAYEQLRRDLASFPAALRDLEPFVRRVWAAFRFVAGGEKPMIEAMFLRADPSLALGACLDAIDIAFTSNASFNDILPVEERFDWFHRARAHNPASFSSLHLADQLVNVAAAIVGQHGSVPKERVSRVREIAVIIDRIDQMNGRRFPKAKSYLLTACEGTVGPWDEAEARLYEVRHDWMLPPAEVPQAS